MPYARNARTHSTQQVAQIAASINEFGFCNPVLTDPDGGIIAGHGRVLAARKLGLTEVPVIVLGHLSKNQRQAFMLAGFDQKELGRLLADLPVPVDLDEAPGVEEKVVTVPGDLWLLGNHRLLCGDGTKRDDLEQVLGGSGTMSVPITS
jgi:hypothetical protein